MGGFVYILTNRPNGTLYIGVTAGLAQRIHQHRDGSGSAFARRYGLSRLVWYEQHADIRSAIQRETSLKRWPRAWKVRLILEMNPEWRDLYEFLGC
jgi:putative endonuclease